MKKSFALIVAFICFSGFGYAFDTGPHFDLTRTVLTDHGFGEDAIKVVQVENWLTDYYSATPTARGKAKDEVEKLHFDNLFTTAETTRYWAWLMTNLREATRTAAKDNDDLAMLTTLGMALHATQDFYSHSNWVELHPRIPNGPYRTETFLSAGTAGIPTGVELVTGKYPKNRKGSPSGALIHGNYTTGLNKDSLVRPQWDEAYVFAYCASDEIVGTLEQWAEEVKPGFWKRVQQFAAAPGDVKKLDYDIRAVRSMSMWINAKDEDGHWKGNYSGLHRFFNTFSSSWVSKSNSIFVKQIKERKLDKRLTAHLYDDAATSTPPAFTFPDKTLRFSLHKRAVLVRATLIKEKGDEGRLEPSIDPGGKPDFYSTITIGKQEYRGRVLQDKKEFPDPWFEIHFVADDVASLAVTFAVWDEDDLDPGGDYKDDHVDINPLEKQRDVTFELRLDDEQVIGDTIGSHISITKTFTSAGEKPDDKRGVITGYLTSVRLAPR